MRKYKLIKLKDVCLKITDGSHYSPPNSKEGYPMLSVKDMKDNSFSYEDCKLVSFKEYEKLVKADCKPKLHDVVIAKDGSYLKHVFVIRDEVDQAILSSIGILRPNLQKINPFYLKYYLHTRSVKKEVSKKYVSGSALPRIILKNFGEIEVINKNIESQNKIASVLQKIDDKIELNNRINQELEEMAKLIYDYWFVQFDFPMSEAQANAIGKPELKGKPYKSSGGPMVYNEILKREIPQGWEVKEISAIGNFKNGKGIKKEFIEDKGTILVFGSNGVIGKTNLPLFEEPVITIGRVGANYGEVNYSLRPSWVTDNAVVCQSNSKIYFWWLLFTLRRIDYKSIAGGSAQPLITQGKLKSLFFPIPANFVHQQFHNIIDPQFKKIENLNAQNQQLSELRDWLLPMLMNGQVRVSEGAKKEYKNKGEVLMAAENKISTTKLIKY